MSIPPYRSAAASIIPATSSSLTTSTPSANASPGQSATVAPAARAGDHCDFSVQPSHLLRRVEHVFDLRVAVERVHAELATEAGLLEAAERRRRPHRAVRVDRDHAGVERARNP